MKNVLKILPPFAASVTAWLVARLGGWDAALQMMFLMMGIDLFTGVLCALMGKSKATEGGRFLSREMFQGLSRKMMMLALVVLATALDTLLTLDGVSRAAVIGFYCANEGLSIVENAALLGVPFPQALLDTLEKMKKK